MQGYTSRKNKATERENDGLSSKGREGEREITRGEGNYNDDDDVYYYIGESLKLERETENMCV